MKRLFDLQFIAIYTGARTDSQICSARWVSQIFINFFQILRIFHKLRQNKAILAEFRGCLLAIAADLLRKCIKVRIIY